MNSTWCFFLLFLTLLPSLDAQILIEGKIINAKTKKEIPEVHIYVIKDKDKWISINKTNEDGSFKIRIDSSEINENSSYQFKIDEKKIYTKITEF